MKKYDTPDMFITRFEANDTIRTSSNLQGNEAYDDNELPLMPFVG